jgi:hypothetical protein
VSWHSGSDSDSAFDLLPASYTAFQVKGYNSSTYGHEISKRETDWRDDPEPWRTRTLTRAARHLAAKARELGIPRRKATRAELDRAIATGGPPVGFIGHWPLDPGRRSDPGLVVAEQVDTFPWAEFFDLMDDEEDDMTPEQLAKELQNETSDIALAIRRLARKGTNDAVTSNDARKDGGHDTAAQPLGQILEKILTAASSADYAERLVTIDDLRRELASDEDDTIGVLVRGIVADELARLAG